MTTIVDSKYLKVLSKPTGSIVRLTLNPNPGALGLN